MWGWDVGGGWDGGVGQRRWGVMWGGGWDGGVGQRRWGVMGLQDRGREQDKSAQDLLRAGGRQQLR